MDNILPAILDRYHCLLCVTSYLCSAGLLLHCLSFLAFLPVNKVASPFAGNLELMHSFHMSKLL